MGSERPAFGDLDACVSAALERYRVPGVAIGILHNGAIETRAYGVASVETLQPVTPGTLFQIGSISKVYTAALVMALVEEGRLDLDAPIANWLPDLTLATPEAPHSITLRHLLSHAGGLEGDRFEDPYGLGDDALARAVADFHTLRLLAPPGALWSYSNNGFVLAGRIIETVTGTSFEAVMRERIFEPLGLERSFYFAHEAITHPVAVGHNHEPDTEPEIARNYPIPRYCNPAGGIISTVGDLLKFAQFHLGESNGSGSSLLSAGSIGRMQRRVIPAANLVAAYGLGWAIPRDDVRLIGHGGATNGFQAELLLAPDEQFAIAILANGSRGFALNREIGQWALAHYLGIDSPRPRVITLPAEQLERFAGRYRTRYFTIDVSPAENGLTFNTTAFDPLTGKKTTYPPETVHPIGDREFLFTEGDETTLRIDLIPDPANPAGPPRYLRTGGRLALREA